MLTSHSNRRCCAQQHNNFQTTLAKQECICCIVNEVILVLTLFDDARTHLQSSLKAAADVQSWALSSTNTYWGWGRRGGGVRVLPTAVAVVAQLVKLMKGYVYVCVCLWECVCVCTGLYHVPFIMWPIKEQVSPPDVPPKTLIPCCVCTLIQYTLTTVTRCPTFCKSAQYLHLILLKAMF